MASDLLSQKRSELLKALVDHLDGRNDYVGLGLLHELLEFSNIQLTVISDRMEALGKLGAEL